jgi:hypothetical protein
MNRTALTLTLTFILALCPLGAAAQDGAGHPTHHPAPEAGPAPGGGGMMGGQMGGGMMGQMPGPMAGGPMAGGPMAMMAAMHTAGESLTMMSAMTWQMAEKLSTGRLSAEEAKAMGKDLGEISSALERLTRIMKPQEEMVRLREKMARLIEGMGMSPPSGR